MSNTYKPEAPRDLNRSVCREMVKNGAPNHIFATYFHDAAIAAMDSDYDPFKVSPELSVSKAQKLGHQFKSSFVKDTLKLEEMIRLKKMVGTLLIVKLWKH